MSVKIILVDDDPISIFLCRKILERDQFANDSVSFSNGKQAIEYLDANHNALDQSIIFLDINMPIMGGWEFLDAVNKRSYSNTLSVIMVTSSFDGNERRKAKEDKLVVAFIEKPIGAESIDNIRKICHKIIKRES